MNPVPIPAVKSMTDTREGILKSSLSNHTTKSGYWAKRLGACAAVGLGVAGVLATASPARAQLAENAACGAATAAAINAKWAAEQAFAARDALANISMNLRMAGGAAAAAAAAESDVANANAASAFAAAQAAREAANSACSAAYAAIVSSGVQKRGVMGMSYCSPITTLGGPALAPGENPLGDGRFFEYLYGYPLIDYARGISPSQQPVHIVVRNCRNMDPVEVITVTPPPPDTNGTCAPGSFWSGSSLVGCRPCLPGFGGFRGCPFSPPSSQISAVNPPTVTPSPTTTITHGPRPVLIPISRVPRNPTPPLVALLPPPGPNKIGKPIPGKDPCTSSHHHGCKPGTGTMNSGTSPSHDPNKGKAGTGTMNSGTSKPSGGMGADMGHNKNAGPYSKNANNRLLAAQQRAQQRALGAANRKANTGMTNLKNRQLAGADHRRLKSAGAYINKRAVQKNSFARNKGKSVGFASAKNHRSAGVGSFKQNRGGSFRQNKPMRFASFNKGRRR